MSGDEPLAARARLFQRLARFYPVAAFFGGFLWDAWTIGRRARIIDFAMLGAYLLGAALLVIVLARRHARGAQPPEAGETLKDKGFKLAWQAPYLLVQFCFGGIFSALFILCFKSSGYLGSWLTACLLGALLVANEFYGDRYGRKFTLTWALFALNTCLLLDFALPYLLGSLNPVWFYVSTASGLGLTYGLWKLAPPGTGRIGPAIGVVGALWAAWFLGMIAPVPLVNKDMGIGPQFVQEGGRYLLDVPAPAFWQFWDKQSATVRVAEGGRLYGVSAVHAPLGVSAELQHRWEYHETDGWRQFYRRDFHSVGGRVNGFRAYSWVSNPTPGDWRLIVATQDGRTISRMTVRVERGETPPEALRQREF